MEICETISICFYLKKSPLVLGLLGVTFNVLNFVTPGKSSSMTFCLWICWKVWMIGVCWNVFNFNSLIHQSIILSSISSMSCRFPILIVSTNHKRNWRGSMKIDKFLTDLSFWCIPWTQKIPHRLTWHLEIWGEDIGEILDLRKIEIF